MKYKKTMAVFFAAAMFLTAGIPAAAAENNPQTSSKEAVSEKDPKASVRREASVKYSKDSGDFTIEDGVLKGYSGTSETVTIPDGVKQINNGVFSSSSIKKIIIPSSVTSIHSWAFDSCSSLEELSVVSDNQSFVSSNGVLYSKDFSKILRFPRGKASSQFVINANVKTICDSAFYKCTSLSGVTLPSGVTSIEQYAFSSCSSLTSVTIPNSVTSIGDYAFYSCSSLTSVTIPNSVTSIGESAFQYCTNLTSLTLSNGVESLGILAFCSCTSLTSVSIPASVAVRSLLFSIALYSGTA